MSQHIIALGIVRPVKPYQLIAALMHREGTGPYPLSKKLGIPSLQGQIHRYSKGDVKQPAPSTVSPLAKHFGLPLEAFYDEKVATAIAKERGITALPERAPKAAASEAPTHAPPTPVFSEEASDAAHMLDSVKDPELKSRIYSRWSQIFDDLVYVAPAGAIRADSRPKPSRSAKR